MLAAHETIDYGSVSRFRTAFRKDARFEFDWHYHPAYELTLVTNGQGWCVYRRIWTAVPDGSGHRFRFELDS